MRKRLLVIFGIFGLLLAGCHTVPNAAQETKTIAPTGYASEEVQRISLFYDGSLYLYNATGFDLPQKESWEFLGQIAFVNNLEYPTKDLNGTHLNVGQEVYRDPEFPQKLYVKYDSGFALFEAEKATKEETAEYLDYVHAEIRLATSDSLQLKLSNVSNETIIYGEAYTMGETSGFTRRLWFYRDCLRIGTRRISVYGYRFCMVIRRTPERQI